MITLFSLKSLKRFLVRMTLLTLSNSSVAIGSPFLVACLHHSNRCFALGCFFMLSFDFLRPFMKIIIFATLLCPLTVHSCFADRFRNIVVTSCHHRLRPPPRHTRPHLIHLSFNYESNFVGRYHLMVAAINPLQSKFCQQSYSSISLLNLSSSNHFKLQFTICLLIYGLHHNYFHLSDH